MTYSVYSISAPDGTVLYVGMSTNVGRRFKAHGQNRIMSKYAPVSILVLATMKSKEAALRCEHKYILKYKHQGQCLLNVQSLFPLSEADRFAWESNTIEYGMQHRHGTVRVNVDVLKKDYDQLQAKLAKTLTSVSQFIRECIAGYLADN